MEALGWVLALFFAGLAFYFALRTPRAPSSGERSPANGISPTGQVRGPDHSATLREVARYLDRAVVTPLEAALRTGNPREGAEDAVDALRDLVAYGAAVPEAGSSLTDLAGVLREVAGEYTRVSGVAVSVSGTPERVRLARERFKDALFLLLSNADRFGGGANVQVHVERAGSRIEVRVKDAGPGFTGEALLRAFDPFWTSEPDALGLGLPHARQLLEAQGATLSVRNAPDAGGEAVISFPTAR